MRPLQYLRLHIAFISTLLLLILTNNAITSMSLSPPVHRATETHNNLNTQTHPKQHRTKSPPPPKTTTTATTLTRRTILTTILAISPITLDTLLQHQPAANARTPGSKNTTEAILQITSASTSLRTLQSNFPLYATVTPEGQAGNNTAAARRILGGIAPRAGQSAIDVAGVTPLYRLDNAFGVVTRAAIEGGGGSGGGSGGWEDGLDIERFEEIAERVLFAVQKADGDFYGVNFAAKGSVQVLGIYREAKEQVDRGVVDLEEMVRMLRDVGAPGL